MTNTINHNKRWSDEDNKIFLDMLKQGKSYKQIGIRLKRKSSAIKFHLMNYINLNKNVTTLNDMSDELNRTMDEIVDLLQERKDAERKAKENKQKK